MFQILDYLILLSILGFLFSLGPTRILGLGGGLAFLPLCAFYYFFSYVYKRFRKEFTLLALLTLSHVGLNYLAYMEKTKIADFLFIFAAFLLLGLLIVVCHVTLNIRPLKRSFPTSPETLDIRRNITERFFLFTFTGLALYGLFTGFVFVTNPQSRFFQVYDVRYIPIAMLWLILSLLTTLLFLHKLPDQYIAHGVETANQVSIPKLPQMFFRGMVLLFAFGTLAEFPRGQWFVWVESFSLFLLLLLTSWKVWKHVFVPLEAIKPGLESEGVPSLIQDFRFIVKYIAFNFIVGTISLILLAVLSTL